MGFQMQSVGHIMVELKAKVAVLEIVRMKLTNLGAQRAGTFRQIDTYFNVPEGRLKLREVESFNKTELIYYKRENITGPKRSDVFILKIEKPESFRNFLEKLLKIIAIIKKVREIYQYRRTKISSKYIQIHLDTVEKVGTFIEFEMLSSKQTLEKDKKILESLMKELGVKRSQLEKRSYLDLLQCMSL